MTHTARISFQQWPPSTAVCAGPASTGRESVAGSHQRRHRTCSWRRTVSGEADWEAIVQPAGRVKKKLLDSSWAGVGSDSVGPVCTGVGVATGAAEVSGAGVGAPGVGLAATQVDVHERVVVIDVSEESNQLLVLINPEITWKSDEQQVYEEGCLSVPGVYDEVKRAARIHVKALNEKGETFEFDAEGLLAVCVQHELDHLLGKVFVEYLSPLKQNRIKTKIRKQEREAARA